MDAEDAGPEEKAVSKGMALIAAYRAARIAGRPAMRRELQLARKRMREELGRGKRLCGTVPEGAIGDAAKIEGPVGLHAPGAETRAEGSVFAGLMDAALPPPTLPARIMAEALAPPFGAEMPVPVLPLATNIAAEIPAPMPIPPEPIVPESLVPGQEPAAAAPQPATMEAEVAPEPVPPPGLDVLGLGPGMLIRLGQLGIHNAADLAASEVSNVRGALGDISRLINVEAWIDRARAACA
jgi:hypothetical protein